MPTCCAARSKPTARRIDDAQRQYHSAQDEIHATLRHEPFDVEAHARGHGEDAGGPAGLRQVIQGVFAFAASQMSPAGRTALADWPPGRKTASNRQ